MFINQPFLPAASKKKIFFSLYVLIYFYHFFLFYSFKLISDKLNRNGEAIDCFNGDANSMGVHIPEGVRIG